MNSTNKGIGSTLESFLKEEGLYDELHLIAIKTALAYKLQEAMLQRKLSQSKLAKIMGTSRAALARLLNPNNA